ncbi:hypothetical protein JCM8202v2_001984 [Rhodotorula sphaerocarpa]
MFRTLGNQWSDTNPNGIVNAGLAENSLMHDWLTAFWQRKGALTIKHTDLTYATEILGSGRIFKALASFFGSYFDPLVPVAPDHIATSNGLSPMIEHVAAAISDPEDAWLIPAPYYNGFVRDLNWTSQVRIASVDIPFDLAGSTAEVRLLDAEMERRNRDGVTQKITAVLVTNPHNPLGFCYPKEVLLAYCRFAERWNLFLVVDEVYATSVYDSPDLPNAAPFTSVLSLDVRQDAGCDPARIMSLYGMSKDFGANGFRGGALDILWSALLTSTELPSYLAQNRHALMGAYTYLTNWLKAHDFKYMPAHAGHFVLVDFREQVEKIARRNEPTPASDGGRFRHEISLLNQFIDNGVCINPGFSFACPVPGFFRITFCIRREELEVALDRIEKVCGLPRKALTST